LRSDAISLNDLIGREAAGSATRLNRSVSSFCTVPSCLARAPDQKSL
jgi:hypothetical protein